VTGTSGMAARPVDELSGGELQRVWLATCLAQRTNVLLLDRSGWRGARRPARRPIRAVHRSSPTGQGSVTDSHHYALRPVCHDGRQGRRTVMTEHRDRDAGGRPRQARPRDALGRPLPYGTEGVEPVSEEPLPPTQTVEVARQLVREGRPFAAHEVLEARWKAGPPDERDLWQGLAQVCVGLTHAARGNSVGGLRLVERGAERLTRYGDSGGSTYDLDLAAVLECARRQVAPGS
jgi:hypothetical protein